MARATCFVLALLLSSSAVFAACGGKSASSETSADAAAPDAGALDATSADGASAVDANANDAGIFDAAEDANKAAACALTFGNALTPAFARLDGTVVAVIPPGDNACTAPNATHLVIQVMMGGAVYRMVVDVLSDQGSPDVLFMEMDNATLIGGAWADGWHTTAMLDYVTTMNLHSTSFVATKEADLVAKITSEIDIGAKISVYATATSAEPDSAHLVHRNLTNQDGAIVINPDSAKPHYLLMHFDEQDF